MIYLLFYVGNLMTTSFEFDYFIKFSQKLLENKQDIVEDNFQCVYRTILSRVYYSAFHHAKYWLEINYNFKTQEFNFETGKLQNKNGLSEHVQVFKELRSIAKDQKDLKNQFRNASSKLEYLFDKRIDADYHEDLTFEEIEVTDAIENAIYIIKLLPFN